MVTASTEIRKAYIEMVRNGGSVKEALSSKQNLDILIDQTIQKMNSDYERCLRQ